MFNIYRQSLRLRLGICKKSGGLCQWEPSTRSFSTTSNDTTGARRRTTRRRRPVASRLATQQETINNGVEANERFEKQVNAMVDSVAGFVATEKDGRETTMDEYLKFASLSPWVPCPDPVARRCLEIAGASAEDIHYELGSGDGRLNFHAIDVYGVKKSIGIDIDPSLVKQSNERIAKRHPAPTNIKFICADLMEDNADSKRIWDDIRSECTVMTMFFVEDALQKIKPLLEKKLVGSKCKVVTIGYDMKGWEPVWVEVILGLTVHLYELNNLDQLYNSSERFNVSELDEELNVISKQKLAEMKEDEGQNPFANDSPAQRVVLEDEGEEDYHWDFDEDEVYDDDDANSKQSDAPKR